MKPTPTKDAGLPMGREVPQGRDVTARAEEERASMEVKGYLFMAQQSPRNEEKAMREVERLARIPEFAAKAYYSYPRSKTEIFGPSVHLTDEMKRLWRNIMTKQAMPYEDADGFLMEVTAWDFEANNVSTRQVIIKSLIQRKDASGRTAWVKPDERDKRELMERHHSLLRRNCILNLFPRWFVDKVVEACRETVKKKAGRTNIDILRQKVEKDFEAMGIYRDQVEKYIGHSLTATTVEEIAELQGIIQSIRDGNARKDEYFGPGTGAKRGGSPEEKQDFTLDQVLEGEVHSEGEKEGPGPAVTEKEGAPEPAPGDDRILEEFKKALLKCSIAVDVQKYMKEVRSNKNAMRLSDALIGQMANLANERMRDLLKKEPK